MSKLDQKMSVLESELPRNKKKKRSSIRTSKSKKLGRGKAFKRVSSSVKDERNSATNLDDITGEHIDVDSVYGSHKWTIISD
jgi:hypothetical protein